jgi:uncharacterized protein with LGFP repeats
VSALRSRTSRHGTPSTLARLLAGAGLTTALLAGQGALTASPAAAAAEPSYANFELLAQCESGGRWDLNTGNGYYGGLQFSLATWRWIGFSGYPHQHSKDTQIRAGQVLQARSGWGQWPACAAKLDLYGSGGVTATAISTRYQQLGGAGGFLAAPLTGEQGTPEGTGAYRHYQGGSIYWSPATGARFVLGDIRATWGRYGWERSFLGYPATDELATPDGAGRYTHFQGGSVYWSPATGARLLMGDIRATWARYGYERSFLGYPTTDERGAPDGVGRYTHFQGGSVYWSPTTGPKVVTGDIRAAWARQGWERSALGYPTTDQRATPDGVGRYNHFQGGSIYWSPVTGAHAVRGPIRDTWARLGWERSALGYPTGSEQATVDGGRSADFQGGSVYWSAATGAWPLVADVRDAWLAAGGSGSALGYPTSVEQRSADGVWRSTAFERGVAYASTATGVVLLCGALHDAWVAAGGESGPLGRPVEGNTPVAGGESAAFEGGTLTWDSTSGASAMSLTDAGDTAP